MRGGVGKLIYITSTKCFFKIQPVCKIFFHLAAFFFFLHLASYMIENQKETPYFLTRDPSLKPAGAVTNTMEKDGLWCDGLWSSGKGFAMCNYDDNCGG